MTIQNDAMSEILKPDLHDAYLEKYKNCITRYNTKIDTNIRINCLYELNKIRHIWTHDFNFDIEELNTITDNIILNSLIE